ncbi:MAG TPA: VWA domain-containing protein [Acidimicrobiia bacterium]|nr:VWA domain-containing protein [Acidimicrobiia bacterium]
MLNSTFLHRAASSSKILKFNVFLIVALMIAASMAVSFATDGNDPAPTVATPVCGARVVLVLDRSASIGVDNQTGSRAISNANIAAIKTASADFVDALKGPDSYMDLFAFGTLTQRINGAPSWFHINNTANANIQKYAIATTTFKTGASMDDHNQFQDGLNAHSEAFTNWESALKTVNQTRASNSTDPSQRATHIVMFTDGNPTVTVEAAEAAVANNGAFPANLSPALSTPEIYQLARERSFGVAQRIRDKGVKIIPVAVGQKINQASLQNIAGAGNPVYRAASYSELSTMLRQAAANICTPPTTRSWTTTKTADKTTVNPGETVRYTFSVTNTGTSTLSNIEISDPTINFPADKPAAIIVSLAPGETKSRTADYVIPADYAQDTFVNTALVCVPGSATPDCKNPTATVTVTRENPQDGIELTKTVNPTTAKPGDTVTYSFVVKNTGETKLTNVKVTDPLLGGQVGATIAELAPGQSAPVITKTFVIPANATGIIHNVATVTGTPVDGDNEARPDVTDDDDADVTITTVVPPSASSVAIEKTVQVSSGSTTFGETGTFTAGQPVTFKIKVTNTGDTRLKNVKVGDANATECSKGGEDSSILIPDQVSEYTCVHTAGYTANTTNTVIVTGNPIDGNGAPVGTPVSATDTAQVNVTAVPSIKIDKTADQTTAAVGSTVNYTFVVTNTSTVTLSNITVTDNVIGDIGTIATLAPGASFTKTVAFVVPASAVGTLRNVATACFTAPVANPNCASDDHSLIVTTVAVGGEVEERTSAGGDSLPFTGSQTVWLATVAGLILALGGVMFALSRKRKENNAY